MSMAQHVFAKFISVIKFYHWRQNVHMPFNFHNIFTHHTHTRTHRYSFTVAGWNESARPGGRQVGGIGGWATDKRAFGLGKYYDGNPCQKVS